MEKLNKSDIRKLIKEIVLEEGFLDFFKKKPIKPPEKTVYNDVNEWIKDNVDEDNRYIGRAQRWFGFPLFQGDYIPIGAEETLMYKWNEAISEEMRQNKFNLVYVDKTKDSRWLRGS